LKPEVRQVAHKVSFSAELDAAFDNGNRDNRFLGGPLLADVHSGFV